MNQIYNRLEFAEGMDNRVTALEDVSLSAVPVICRPNKWEHSFYPPTHPNRSSALYECDIELPSKGILTLGLDGFIRGETCNFMISVDGEVAGTEAFTLNPSVYGESGHASVSTAIEAGRHTIGVSGSRWRGSDACYLGGGGISGVFIPTL